jgi:hypothetical protein
MPSVAAGDAASMCAVAWTAYTCPPVVNAMSEPSGTNRTRAEISVRSRRESARCATAVASATYRFALSSEA